MEEDEEAPTETQIKIPEPPVHMKIKHNYVPKTKRPMAPEATSLCPLCNQAIPASELQEHMRIELLDPKWREQKMAMEAKKKDSNLTSGTLKF
jgi:splicing factor 3A subunit 1